MTIYTINCLHYKDQAAIDAEISRHNKRWEARGEEPPYQEGTNICDECQGLAPRTPPIMPFEPKNRICFRPNLTMVCALCGDDHLVYEGPAVGYWCPHCGQAILSTAKVFPFCKK